MIAKARPKLFVAFLVVIVVVTVALVSYDTSADVVDPDPCEEFPPFPGIEVVDPGLCEEFPPFPEIEAYESECKRMQSNF